MDNFTLDFTLDTQLRVGYCGVACVRRTVGKGGGLVQGGHWTFRYECISKGEVFYSILNGHKGL